MFDLTIITVCFNDWEQCLRTINSVQSFRDATKLKVQHIVQDGGSEDVQKFNAHAYDIDFQSRQDTGIYSGMNNALERARGKFVWFLNSGDLIHSNLLAHDGIRMFEHALSSDLPKLTFEVHNQRFGTVYAWQNSNSRKYRAMLHHQGTLIHRVHCQSELYYDERLKFRGDYELFLRLDRWATKRFPLCVCCYEGNGVSTDDKNAFTFFREEIEIDLKHKVRKKSLHAFEYFIIYRLIFMRKIKRSIKKLFT